VKNLIVEKCVDNFENSLASVPPFSWKPLFHSKVLFAFKLPKRHRRAFRP